ncbi:hypothetical protein GCM10010145_34250 [Streptomyces ruber]|uniref:Uncharacterized protein n=2 Tax=Streptomyces TaxID=1883 RepID=A0A918ERL5_9ACTN|nr:V-type ATP synthase subunit D [Streptomyces ruber]GGQ61246.1 hypothetical protein GCM10010145_34250 [Streptomyces ruber]
MADVRIPLGRAGRMRLRRSLDAALRGADLLDRKPRILRASHETLLRTESTARERWHRALREAETWLWRGLLLGGKEALDTLIPPGPAEVEFAWTSTMGVRHPGSASCTVPERDPAAPAPPNTSLVHTEAAYAEAVRGVAEYAAARAAARAVGPRPPARTGPAAPLDPPAGGGPGPRRSRAGTERARGRGPQALGSTGT